MEIPEFETKKELFEYLRENKKNLIKEKKSKVKHTEAVVTCGVDPSELVNTKSSGDVISVKVVANSAMVLDSDMDVLITGCYDKTIEDRKGMIPHLHDHIHQVSANVGDVKDVYTEDVALKALGLIGDEPTQCLIFETDIIKSYNEQVFSLYQKGRVNQHSIGLNYEKIDLAANDEDDDKAKSLYDEYIGKIINPEKALKKGFFWVVKEITLLENSAVLFGSNHATPTLSSSAKRPNLLSKRKRLHELKFTTNE